MSEIGHEESKIVHQFFKNRTLLSRNGPRCSILLANFRGEKVPKKLWCCVGGVV